MSNVARSPRESGQRNGAQPSYISFAFSRCRNNPPRYSVLNDLFRLAGSAQRFARGIERLAHDFRCFVVKDAAR